MRERKKKKWLIGFLCCVLVFMGVGYAVLNQVLNITSTANVTGNFNIIIDNIEAVYERTNGATNVRTSVSRNTTALYEANFYKPGDYITYDVTVKNNGNIKGVLKSIVIEQKPDETMKASLDEFDITVDQVFETKAYQTNSEIEVGLDQELDVGETYNFDIRTLLKNINFIPKGVMTTKIQLIYVQIEGPNTSKPGGEIEDDYNGPDIEVNADGLLTRMNIDNYTKNDGWLELPAETSDGSAIKSIDRNSFLKYNAVSFCDEDKENGEVTCGVVIYDENHFDKIKEIIESDNWDDGYGNWYGTSGYYSSNDLSKKVVPSKLISDESKKSRIKKLSGSASGSGVHDIIFYKPSEIASLEFEDPFYIFVDLETEKCYEAKNLVEKLDLTKASNLTKIEEDAFKYSQLSEIKFNNSVTTIESGAFRGSQITGALVLPNSIEHIGNNAFAENRISGVLVIPQGVKTIEYNSFTANQISGLELSNEITSIGSDAFSNNEITKLNIPNSVISIGSSAFSNNKINELVVPNSLTSVGEWAFYSQNYDESSGGYLGINKVTIGKYFYRMFGTNENYQQFKISELTIESGDIERNSFKNAGITKLTLGDRITSIGEDAFYNNPLTLINIQRTQQDFSINVTTGTRWYDGNPTITYKTD